MSEDLRAPVAFTVMAVLLAIVGFTQSWSVSLSVINLCIISSIMAIGVNLQWGYGGLFNAGVMGFTALGGLTAVLVSHDPIYEAWDKAGIGIVISAIIFVLSIIGDPSIDMSIIPPQVLSIFNLLRNGIIAIPSVKTCCKVGRLPL